MPITTSISIPLRRGRRAAPWFACFALPAAEVACGSGGDSSGPASPGPQLAPGGLYVGYDAEDPVTNPEDPTLGVLHLALPAGDAAFSGAMFFAEFGCQSSDVGAIGGTRSGNALAGSWSSTLDGSPQSGGQSGHDTAASDVFSGTDGVAGAKQFRNPQPCISCTIVPGGTWELLAAGASVPARVVLGTTGTQVRCSNPPPTREDSAAPRAACC
jgi:hypothetical protein